MNFIKMVWRFLFVTTISVEDYKQSQMNDSKSRKSNVKDTYKERMRKLDKEASHFDILYQKRQPYYWRKSPPPTHYKHSPQIIRKIPH